MVARVVRGAQWLEFIYETATPDGALTRSRAEFSRYIKALAKAEKELRQMSPVAQRLVGLAYGNYKRLNPVVGPLFFGNPLEVGAFERDWTPYTDCAA